MAYPTVDAPYGLKPINLIGGQVYSGSTRQMPIASGYGTSIFNGDVVKPVNDGTIAKDTGTTTATPLGVFLGCTYTDPNTSQVTFKQYFPASTAASDIMGYIVDDPDVLFKVAMVSSGTTVAGYGRTVVGNNVPLVQNSGSTTTGNSGVGILAASAATTLSLPMRIVDVVSDTKNSSGNYVEAIVKWNEPYNVEATPNTTTGGHFYRNPIGL